MNDDRIRGAFDRLRADAHQMDTMAALRDLEPQRPGRWNSKLLLGGAAALVVIALVVVGIAVFSGGDDDEGTVAGGDDGTDQTADGGQTDGTDDAGEDGGVSPELTGVTWQLVSGTGPDGELAVLDQWPVTLSFADGVAALREAEGSGLDLVVVDGTDPVGPAAGLIESEFYETVAAALSPAGVFTAQTQSPFYHPEAITKIYRGLGEAFANVRMYWGVCPSYLGAFWTFAYASQERDPLRDLVPPTGLETRYWTPEVHRAAFVLPPFVQACLPEGHPQRTHV